VVGVKQGHKIGALLAEGWEKIDDRTVALRSDNICDLMI
jgi:hypothetical protein